MPNASEYSIGQNLDLYKKERATALSHLSGLTADFLEMTFEDFALLPEKTQKEAMLSFLYNLGQTEDSDLIAACKLLGLSNWSEPFRVEKSLKRTKKRFVDLANNNPFDYFVTLTLDKLTGVDRYDLCSVKAWFRKAIKNFERKYDCKLEYIFIPEHHEDGAWHLHGLVLGVPLEALVEWRYREAPFKIKRRMQEGKTVYKCPYLQEKLGFTDFEVIENKKAVSRYCTKYITKDLLESQTEKGTRLLLRSRGLKEPVHGELPEKLQKHLDVFLNSAEPSFTAYRNWSDKAETEKRTGCPVLPSYLLYELDAVSLTAFETYCAFYGITLDEVLQTPGTQDP